MNFITIHFVLTSLLFMKTIATVSKKCGLCDRSTCMDLTGCPPQHVIKDMCNCCQVCVTVEELSKPRPKAAVNACSSIDCPRFQICMLNMQELPVCRCPNKFTCAQVKGQEICGQDKVTYKTRCHKSVAQCQQRRKIKMAYKGRCIENISEVSIRKLGRISRQEVRRLRRRRLRNKEKRKRGYKKANKRKLRYLRNRKRTVHTL